MNYTPSFFLTRQERQQFESAWRVQVAQRELRAPSFLLQALLRGRDPLRGFSPVTNANKLGNGQHAWQGYREALAQLHAQPGWHLNKLWPQLMGESLGPTRYEAVLAELKPMLAQLRAGAANPAQHPRPSLAQEPARQRAPESQA